ncbi:protein phosphatase 2C domain-containing protein [Rhizobium sp. 'Codium 1']|uniref:protein phosphatase 2C domain-containing protein n=1 Tax=Rhizobium sp. 'Codium 1' TaxID=2940484 RepID=UPI001E5D9D8F|nr:protein phosphatase 2C domain-containing protein [Rhizobium sp. 'Codium 1']MCC8934756.1 protein phosphatase 2C domain-containing protein [Rhizobium sp. 'Codium 1']
MPQISIIDTVSDPGKAGRPNEDRLGYNSDAAFVIDGATGLGQRQFMEGYGSDAAWIAEFAAIRFEQRLTRSADPKTVLRQVSEEARDTFLASAGDQPRYAWPLCSLSALQVTDTGIRWFGLGDSCLYILHDDGRSDFVIPIPGAYEWEQHRAAQHIARVGGIGAAGVANDDLETLEDLRRCRALQNTPDGTTWTFGVVPDAADHLAMVDIPVHGGGATALLCSDGLADLVALYKLYDPATMIQRAATAGLKSLVMELRHLEREVDPDGLKYPRYKQSDDTTAILLRLEV